MTAVRGQCPVQQSLWYFMDRYLAYLVEKVLDLGFYATRGMTTPNPFRPPDEAHPWWYASRPEDFYAVDDAPPELHFDRFRNVFRGEQSHFTFISPYKSPHAENNTVHGLVDLRPQGQARAALIFLHGHTMTNFATLRWFSRIAIRQEFDLYYLALPYHMQRAPRGTWSGQHSLNSDVKGTALAFMQGVRDVRALINWIVKERGTPVALAGVSLGAYTACMTAVVDSRLKAVVSILGGASLARIPWGGYQSEQIRRQLKAGGVSLDDLERYWMLLSPGRWQPAISTNNVLLIGGKFDKIVSPRNVEALWQAWGQPQLCWYPCGHVTIALYYREVAQVIARFLEERV